jgi:hypothetical protein
MYYSKERERERCIIVKIERETIVKRETDTLDLREKTTVGYMN